MISATFLIVGLPLLFVGIQAYERVAAYIFALAGILSILIGLYLA